jgi:cytochrome c oxidase assembly factor CtaG
MQTYGQLGLSWIWIGWGNAAAIGITGLLYTRGWICLHQLLPEKYSRLRLAAFLSGLTVLWLALAPALESLSALLLSVHMVQHLLLLVVAPPLLFLGSPELPLLRGLPRSLAHDGIAPFLRFAEAKKITAFLQRPLLCWLAFVGTLIAWHIPIAFDLALHSTGWHHFEHACFLTSALLFWGPVVRGSEHRPGDSGWILPVYLLAADLVNTALSALLTFSDRVLYPPYATVPRLFGTTPLTDQTAAGVIMWVPGSLFFLGPAFVIALRQASTPGILALPASANLPVAPRRRPADQHSRYGVKKIDLLQWPILGAVLQTGRLRRTLQIVLGLLAMVVVADGFLGPKTAGSSLACVLPWTYWRFFAVLGLVVAGNLSCMVCPFTLPRELGRSARGSRRPWPRALRTKWAAVGLLLLFVWAYETFSLWNLPAATAVLVIAYFSASYLVGRFFEGASFCRYLCPIGQFQFIGSLVSPLEVKVRRPDACLVCTTRDCIRGNDHAAGCEMGLHLPVKQGNMDCTMCLSCVRACPHENIGLFFGAPGRDLVQDGRRSSAGRWWSRSDIVALSLVFVFAAFANAAAMAAPVMQWRDQITVSLGLSSTMAVTTAFFLASLVLLPAALITGSVAAGFALAHLKRSFTEIARRLSLALIPLGLAMWTSHLLLHFIVGWNSLEIVLCRLARFAGIQSPGSLTLSAPFLDPAALLRCQVLLLGLGLLGSLYIGWRVVRDRSKSFGQICRFVAPWSLVCTGLYFAGIWIFLQPMYTGMTL